MWALGLQNMFLYYKSTSAVSCTLMLHKNNIWLVSNLGKPMVVDAKVNILTQRINQNIPPAPLSILPAIGMSHNLEKSEYA